MQTIPEVEEDLRDLRCCDGDQVTFECSFVSGDAPFDVRWEKGGKVSHAYFFCHTPFFTHVHLDCTPWR